MSSPRATAKRRVLVVDDESIVAHDISECLTHMGCEVLGTALSGPDAIARAEQFRPDLVMMDIVLQGSMDGVEAATIIRQRLDIPCVFLTAYSDGAVLARAKAAAPAGYIVKPFEEANLRSTVEIALYKVDLERALRESRQWFMTTLLSIGDGVIATGADGRIKLMNPVAARLTGWACDRAEGLPVEEVFDVIDEQAGQPAANLARNVLDHGQRAARDGGFLLRHRDGQVTPVADCAAPIRSAGGVVTGAVLIFRDITERRRAQMEIERQHMYLEEQVQQRTSLIRQTNERLLAEVEDRRRAEQALARRVESEKLVASLSSAFLRTSPPDMDQTMMDVVERIARFVRADRCALLQHSACGSLLRSTHEWCAPGVTAVQDEFQNMPAHALPPLREEPESHTAFIFSAVEGPEGPEVAPALAAARRAGSILWVLMAGDTRPAGFLALDSIHRRDWTPDDLRLLTMAAGVVMAALGRISAEADKYRLEGQLQQSLKMEAVGKLSGGIAHDFNNMLTPIIGYSDMILQRLAPDDISATELREIKRAAEQAAALTRQLLAFSRKQVMRKTVFDLSECLASMTRMLRRIIGEDIDLRMELGDSAVPVKADQGQMEQVVMNLVVNARDAMPHGGVIRVRTIVVDAARHAVPLIGGTAGGGQYAVLSVSDSGCGIPKEIQERIFEPFFTTKGMEGTGLGLSVVYGIVQDHLGGLQLESAPGTGTTFHIFLPAALPAELPVAGHLNGTVTAGAAPRGRGERVLLVEDEEAVNRLVRTALTQNGYVVTAANSATEALRRYEEHGGGFEMIFSDAVLPDGNGLQLLDTLLTRNPGLRALLSSGYTDKNSLLQMAKQRRISFLPKPYSLPVLFRTVADVMEDQNSHLLA